MGPSNSQQFSVNDENHRPKTLNNVGRNDFRDDFEEFTESYDSEYYDDEEEDSISKSQSYDLDSINNQ